MKNLVGSLLLIGGTSFVGISAQAQIQINALGSYVSSIGVSDGLRGGGASIRYFTSPHIAIGFNAQHLTKEINVLNITATNKSLYAAGQIEYFMTTSAWQPYVGIEVGLVHHTYKTSVSDLPDSIEVVNAGRTYNFTIGSKAGIQYMITPLIGINAEATYKLVVGKGSPGPGSQALLLNGGIFVKIGKRFLN